MSAYDMRVRTIMNVERLKNDPQDVHHPVMVEEIVKLLQPHSGGKYLDGTVGMGGHAFALLDAAGEYAQLCGLDRDDQALKLAAIRLKPFGNRVHLFHSRYSNFVSVLHSLSWKTLDGVIIDVGVSSLQLSASERGFSFLHDGPLDMRMDQDSDDNVLINIINKNNQEELKNIIFRYGEEPQASRIAKAIVEARLHKPIKTTKELADLIEQAYPISWRIKSRNHPATRTFQAFRIAVNDELNELEKFLDTILSWIVPGGRIAVISFHSLEDRIVKRYMKSWAQGCICPPYVYPCKCYHTPEVTLITTKPIRPSEKEIVKNSCARSAKLRVAEKCIFNNNNQLSFKERYEARKAKRALNKKK